MWTPGSVDNTATATGADPNGTATSTDTDSVPIAGRGGSGDRVWPSRRALPTGNGAGDTVDYGFVVTNTGNVTLTGISDRRPDGGRGRLPGDHAGPGESTTCTATYTLTQADVDAGVVDNTATVTGTDPNGTEVDRDRHRPVPIPAPPISLAKSGTLNGNAAGDTVDYEFVVTNTGNVTLDPVERR